jgi:hypothetical protein
VFLGLLRLFLAFLVSFLGGPSLDDLDFVDEIFSLGSIFDSS